MTQSNREKMLVLLFPAVILTIGYVWRFDVVAKSKQLIALNKEIDKAEQTRPADGQFRGPQIKIASLNREVDKYQKEQTAARQAWDAMAAATAKVDQRNERIERLTNIVRNHHLVIMDDGEADAGKLPQGLEVLAKLMTDKSKNQQPQLRRLHFHGTYVDVYAVLQELSQGEVVAVPVGLTMMPSKNNPGQREWTMLVWI